MLELLEPHATRSLHRDSMPSVALPHRHRCRSDPLQRPTGFALASTLLRARCRRGLTREGTSPFESGPDSCLVNLLRLVYRLSAVEGVAGAGELGRG